MHKKTLGLFLTGVLFSFCSCVDATYDLANKEIATDVEFKDNKLSMPLGSLQAFMIDSLINGIELIGTNKDGVYCIEDSNEQHMEKFIHPIEFKIGSRSFSVEQSVPTVNLGQALSIKELPISFALEENFNINDKVSNQFARIYACTFEEELAIRLNLKLEGLDAIQADAADLNLTINFPPFFKKLRSEDNNVSAEGTRVRITKEYLAQNSQGLDIKLYCSGFDFEAEKQAGLEVEVRADGSTYLSHQSTMKANGQVTLRNNNSGLALSGSNSKIAMSMEIDFDDIAVQVVDGVFQEEFYKVDSIVGIDLGDLAATLEEANRHIRLAAPYLEVVLDNNIIIPLKKIELAMFGKNKEGELLTNTIVETEFHLNQTYDKATGEILPGITKLLLTSNKDLRKEGFETVETPNLAKWLEQIPDSIGYSAHPILDKSKRVHISIDRAISLGATCKTVIPLSFEMLQLEFCDTVPVNLEDSLDMLSNAELKLKMTVSNTLPLGLSIKTTALDEHKQPVGEITISAIDIDPCQEDDCTLQTTLNKKKVEIAIKSENVDFAKMKHLKFEYEIYTEENNEVGFKPTQGIQITDIAIEISGDIKTDMNE